MNRLCQASSLIDAHVDAVLGLRAAEQVLRRRACPCRPSAARKSSLSAAKCSGVIALLVLPHQTVVLGLGIADDELVLGAAAGVLAGLDDQRAVLGEQALAAAHRMLDQRRGRRDSSEDLGAGRDALRVKAAARNAVGHVEISSPNVKCGGDRFWACRRMSHACRRAITANKVAAVKTAAAAALSIAPARRWSKSAPLIDATEAAQRRGDEPA